ncbi:hypothetical protein FACS1894139_19490 [Planctomycetales bacterium]|nr:hypothetical protein FACS1894107_12100 [Planctomycetales bacterium]GHT00475.1 hypothetical protein FACS1894108_12620 [Planctomycetales bacterium]GHT09445.1 hypothetical protein FACS1894139_19490 [Planctomycetales bacterium]
MQAIRQIIDAEQLSTVVELPAEMQAGEVEIIVMAAPKRSPADIFRAQCAEMRKWAREVGLQESDIKDAIRETRAENGEKCVS